MTERADNAPDQPHLELVHSVNGAPEPGALGMSDEAEEAEQLCRTALAMDRSQFGAKKGVWMQALPEASGVAKPGMPERFEIVGGTSGVYCFVEGSALGTDFRITGYGGGDTSPFWSALVVYRADDGSLQSVKLRGDGSTDAPNIAQHRDGAWRLTIAPDKFRRVEFFWQWGGE